MTKVRHGKLESTKVPRSKKSLLNLPSQLEEKRRNRPVLREAGAILTDVRKKTELSSPCFASMSHSKERLTR